MKASVVLVNKWVQLLALEEDEKQKFGMCHRNIPHLNHVYLGLMNRSTGLTLEVGHPNLPTAGLGWLASHNAGCDAGAAAVK